ncbi:MAG: sigma-54-dependent Fis family transcriptional regulator, partial [Gluconacetobacter diazotrophicus]|nr:sigma-54-dependent Fis family transcriptional regulator [Gluconacetobacter diazotrophicus]
LPPLRDRIADIVPLAEHFLRQAGGPPLDGAAAAVLVRHAWPGNVRELKNAMQRVAALAHGPSVSVGDLAFLVGEERAPAGAGEITWPEDDIPTAVAKLEEFLIRRALARAGGNRTEAARALNIRRQFLYAKLERYGFGAPRMPEDEAEADKPGG